MSATVAIARTGARHEGHELLAATIASPSGLRMRVLDLGGIIWSLHVPDAHGGLRDVVLGHDDPAAYLADPYYLGAITGRCAGRIADARFVLDGEEHRLTANAGRHHLHGGTRGFNAVRWAMAPTPDGVRLTYVSPDGEEGYPGTLEARVEYALTDDGAVEVRYEAVVDRATPVNLTQHSYFNLAGSGNVLDHVLRVHAERWLEIDAHRLPTGTVAPVAGGPLDLRAPRRLGDLLAEPALHETGLDHSFVLSTAREPGALVPAAELHCPASGITLRVATTEPSVHCYAAGLLRGGIGKGGRTHRPHDALCLETQHFPDAPNQPSFPDTTVRPGRPFTSRTRFAFGTAR